MKKNFTFLLLSFVFAVLNAQVLWQKTTMKGENIRKSAKETEFYTLDLKMLREKLVNAKEKGQYTKPIEIEIPNSDGVLEKFSVYSFPVMDRAMAEKYGLGSYAGVSMEDPTKFIRFSTSTTDFASMTMKDGDFQFIDVANNNKTVYSVHSKTYPNKKDRMFLCSTKEGVLSQKQIEDLYKNNFAKSSDKKFRTMRLALSVTGEYTAYFGGTVAGALTAMNNTMTRVNGVLEKDLALHLDMINNTTIIYTNAATDPYSIASTGANGAWNKELMNTLHTVVGDTNFDIGHLFGASGGGGNAGCIGCVCSNDMITASNYKGSGFTSPADGIPSGDNFDIDYVVHEIGHQLGANHTFSYDIEGTGVNVEPGSGSTIMGYAGITGATDVQAHSDPYFHILSIDQIQSNLRTTTCDVETSIANNPPVIGALANYTIPKSTAFVLNASATDAEGDPLTYCWEQVDDATTSSNIDNLGTLTNGPNFRSYSPTTSGTRYFPKLSTVLAGNLKSTTDWESVSTVARTTNFRISVRDNNPNVTQQQTQSSKQTIIVGSDGPFSVTATKVYNNSNQNPITWSVANTTSSPYNVSNVKIDYTKDNGTTWTILSNSTPNDGTETFDFSSLATGTNIIVRVSAIGNVFYAVGKISVSRALNCDGTAPTNVLATSVTPNSANVNWDLVAAATYIIRYRTVGSSAWMQMTSSNNFITLSGLFELSQYEVQVAAVCSGTTGTFSPSLIFKTLSSINYCLSKSNDKNSEYISKVSVGTMSNISSNSVYTDYTSDPTKQINLVSGETYTISVEKSWFSDIYDEAISAWIDWNRDGVFDNSELVLNSSLDMATPISKSFIVPSMAYTGLPLRLRVIMSDAVINTDCGVYDYGETEDYNVNVKLATNGVSQVYPNPASDELKVSNVSANASYKIFAIDGKLVKNGMLNNNATNVSGLLKGVYLITVTDKDKVNTIKFIKK